MKDEKRKTKVIGEVITNWKMQKIKESLLEFNNEWEIENIVNTVEKENKANALVNNNHSLNWIKSKLQQELAFFHDTFLDKFMTQIVDKSDSAISEIFKNKIKEYYQGVQWIIDKSNQQLNTAQQKLQSTKEKETYLLNQKIQMEIQESKLQLQLDDSNQSINKLNNNYEKFVQLKPKIEYMLQEFNTNDPKKLVHDMVRRFDEYEECKKDLEGLNNTMDKLKNQKSKNTWDSRHNLELLSKTWSEVEDMNSVNINSYEKKLDNLRTELSNYLDYKSKNSKLHNMWIQIYNILYPKLNWERGLKEDPSIPLVSDDYRPRSYDVNEVLRYIGLMIKNSNESSSDSLLRETIAYSNMMLRKEIKDNINNSYNPVYIFNCICNLIWSLDNENINWNSKIAVLQNEWKKNAELIKHLEDEKKEQFKQEIILRNKDNFWYKERNLKRIKQRDTLIMSKNTKKWKNIQTVETPTIKNSSKESDGYRTYLSHTNSLFTHVNESSSNADILADTYGVKRGSNIVQVWNQENVGDNKIKYNRNLQGQIYQLENMDNHCDYVHKPPKNTDGKDNLMHWIDHTNRLFWYNSKIHKGNDRGALNTSTVTNRIDKKFKKLENIRKKNVEVKCKKDQTDKLLTKLDGIINGINYSDKC